MQTSETTSADIPHQTLSLFLLSNAATTDIYTLSLHDPLPISFCVAGGRARVRGAGEVVEPLAFVARTFTLLVPPERRTDRKSTRLNSSHVENSYAVFCLK